MKLDWKVVKKDATVHFYNTKTEPEKLNKVMRDYIDFLSKDEEMASYFAGTLLELDVTSTNPKTGKLINIYRKLDDRQRWTVMYNISDIYWNKELQKSDNQ